MIFKRKKNLLSNLIEYFCFKKGSVCGIMWHIFSGTWTESIEVMASLVFKIHGMSSWTVLLEIKVLQEFNLRNIFSSKRKY